MRSVSFYILAAAAVLASASPLRLRSTSSVHARDETTNDAPDNGLILIVALQQAVAQYYDEMQQAFGSADYQNAGFENGQAISQVISTIAENEQKHFLQMLSIAEVDSDPFSNCTYNFDSLLTDVNTAVIGGRDLLFVSIGGYSGVISNEPSSQFLEQFAETMTSVGRAAEVMNVVAQGTALSQIFEISLTTLEVVTQLSAFEPSCSPQLSFQPLPQFNITGITNGNLNIDASNTPCADEQAVFCQLLGSNSSSFEAFPVDECAAGGFAGEGEIMVYLTTDTTPLPNTSTDREVPLSSICAGPKILFIDEASRIDKLLLATNSTN